MELLIGAYIVAGISKTAVRFASSDKANKPLWMLVEKNRIKVALRLVLHVVAWPLAGK